MRSESVHPQFQLPSLHPEIKGDAVVTKKWKPTKGNHSRLVCSELPQIRCQHVAPTPKKNCLRPPPDGSLRLWRRPRSRQRFTRVEPQSSAATERCHQKWRLSRSEPKPASRASRGERAIGSGLRFLSRNNGVSTC